MVNSLLWYRSAKTIKGPTPIFNARALLSQFRDSIIVTADRLHDLRRLHCRKQFARQQERQARGATLGSAIIMRWEAVTHDRYATAAWRRYLAEGGLHKQSRGRAGRGGHGEGVRSRA